MRLILVLTIIALCYATGTSLNDLADEKVDQVNLQKFQAERPLIKGNASRSDLVVLSIVAALYALVASLFISPLASIFTFVALCYGYFYSLPPLRLSHHGFAAILTLPAWYVVYPFSLGFLAAGETSFDTPALLGLIVPLYACFIARIILKDVRDVEGDKKHGKKTFIVRYGLKATGIFSIAFWLIGITGLMFFFKNIYFYSATLTLAIAALITLIKLTTEPRFENRLIEVAAIGRFANGILILILAFLVETNHSHQLYLTGTICLLFFAMGVEALLHLQPSLKT